jgi:transcriptional regulator with PAS, ATPase and Fis domain
VALLAQHFAGGKSRGETLPREFLVRLGQHRWPGNVRELRNVIERALVLFPTPSELAQVTFEELGATLFQSESKGPGESAPGVGARSEAPRSQERERILQALQESAGNQTLAARKLGVSRVTLMARLDAFGIARPRKGTKGLS